MAYEELIEIIKKAEVAHFTIGLPAQLAIGGVLFAVAEHATKTYSPAADKALSGADDICVALIPYGFHSTVGFIGFSDYLYDLAAVLREGSSPDELKRSRDIAGDEIREARRWYREILGILGYEKRDYPARLPKRRARGLMTASDELRSFLQWNQKAEAARFTLALPAQVTIADSMLTIADLLLQDERYDLLHRLADAALSLTPYMVNAEVRFEALAAYLEACANGSQAKPGDSARLHEGVNANLDKAKALYREILHAIDPGEKGYPALLPSPKHPPDVYFYFDAYGNRRDYIE
ncbi:hypothetical protein CcI6DRAFT_02870 [Frankia sp. CcI6]|uniref:hypothetical protein n=1 Tax=unclassified Frankia TaxID=2632575 RepID=UPI0003CFD10C|nr:MULTISPECIES: hypothetical protein [unclassified Frankia]ETA01690.1 hypothetical protein CcI6DRAFT_02870 [Frankia sp. CcI6]KFB03868.1 hypothetical protein ALLO2DRAFT_03384 [Frankia sp. Allo2]